MSNIKNFPDTSHKKDPNWNPFGDIKKQAEDETAKLSEKERELDKLIFRVFSSNDGKKVLDYFKKNTLDKPVCMPQMGAWDGAATGFFREGQNSIIREIQIRMERAKGY